MKPQTKPFTVEVRSSRRTGPSPWPTPQPIAASSVAEAVFADPQPVSATEPLRVGRILPALEPTPATEHASSVEQPQQKARRGRPKEGPATQGTIPDPEKVEAVRSVIADVITKAAVAQTATSPSVREENAAGERASRKSFRREQRWMHRLPAVISRKHARPIHG